MIAVRHEAADDVAAIRLVNERAFERTDEADLIDALRAADAATLSLVAVLGQKIVGHILFTHVDVIAEHSRYAAVALGPMAVQPTYQKRVVGSKMILAALDELRQAGHGVVVVLGHPHYYPRFGFVPASRYGIRCPYDAPDEAFMALNLREGEAATERLAGTVRYHPAFDSV